jgi:hypothetical protein
LGDQLCGAEAEGEFEFAEFFVGGGVGDAAGFDEGEVGFGDAGASGEFVEGEAEAAALFAEFGAEGFHGEHW